MLVLALSPAPALAQFERIAHSYRVDPNMTRAHERAPLAPLIAADGEVVVAGPGEPVEAAFAAHWARRRRLAPNPDPTITGTGNQWFQSYSLANFQWNYGGAFGVAATSPYQIVSGVPTSVLGCVGCYVHLDVSAHGSIDFRWPGWLGCDPYCLGEVGAYIEGVADVRGTVNFVGPYTFSDTSTTSLLPSRSCGSFTIPIGGLPLTIYAYLEVNAIVTASATVDGNFSFAASFYQQANVGATYNPLANPNNPVALINQWPAPVIRIPIPKFFTVAPREFSLSVVIEPKMTLSLWNVVSVYVRIDPELLLTATMNKPTCDTGASIDLTFGTTAVVGMDAITWGAIHDVTGTSWLLGWALSGTIVGASESSPKSVYSPMKLMDTICTSAYASRTPPRPLRPRRLRARSRAAPRTRRPRN